MSLAAMARAAIEEDDDGWQEASSANKNAKKSTSRMDEDDDEDYRPTVAGVGKSGGDEEDEATLAASLLAHVTSSGEGRVGSNRGSVAKLNGVKGDDAGDESVYSDDDMDTDGRRAKQPQTDNRWNAAARERRYDDAEVED